MASTSVSDDEHLDYVVILEFKTTCWDKGMEPLPRLQEIIEFPALLVDTCSGEIVSEFHVKRCRQFIHVMHLLALTRTSNLFRECHILCFHVHCVCFRS